MSKCKRNNCRYFRYGSSYQGKTLANLTWGLDNKKTKQMAIRSAGEDAKLQGLCFRKGGRNIALLVNDRWFIWNSNPNE